MPTAKPPPSPTSIYDIRRENLTRLLSSEGAKTQLALRLGVTQARISQLLKPSGGEGSRRITTDQARELEQIMGLSSGALDQSAAQPMPPRGGEPSKQLLFSSLKSVAFAASEMGVTLSPEILSELAGTVYDLSKPGKLLEQPVVKALVQQAIKR